MRAREFAYPASCTLHGSVLIATSGVTLSAVKLFFDALSPLAHSLNEGDHVLRRDVAGHGVRWGDDVAAASAYLIH